MRSAIAWISLGLASASTLWIAGDELRHPQKMWIMNIVWPVTTLYFSVVAAWAYYRIGRPMSRKRTLKQAAGSISGIWNRHEGTRRGLK